MKLLVDVVTDVDQTIEVEAKGNLRLSARDDRGRWVVGGGRGERTGTLKRSIHAAPPDYAWARDDVEPGPGTPERGGKDFEPEVTAKKVTGAVGSGMRYAIYLHQSRDSEGAHYILRAFEKVRAGLGAIIARHRSRRRAR